MKPPTKPGHAPPSTVNIPVGVGTFVDPFDDEVLSAYLDSVLKWHGYIRFVSLPHLRDNPDVPIDQLYVEPSIAESVSSDREAAVPASALLCSEPRLVVLGDPGSGKLTLVSWLAWQFARRAEGN